MTVLVDTNILARLAEMRHPDQPACHEALRRLFQQLSQHHRAAPQRCPVGSHPPFPPGVESSALSVEHSMFRCFQKRCSRRYRPTLATAFRRWHAIACPTRRDESYPIPCRRLRPTQSRSASGRRRAWNNSSTGHNSGWQPQPGSAFLP